MKQKPLLDVALALDSMGGDATVFRETVAMYLEIVPKLIEKMDDALFNGDQSAVRNFAHVIKSSSRTIGGMRIGEIAEQLEEQCETSPKERLIGMQAELHQLFFEMCCKLTDSGFRQTPSTDQ